MAAVLPFDTVVQVEEAPDKYRGLVIACLVFLMITLGVLVLTLYFSKGSPQYEQLRWVQTAGMLLALANFVVVLFVLVRRLRMDDAAGEQAAAESRAILKCVHEGMFVLTSDYRLGRLLSQATHTLFGRVLHPGDNFFAVLQPLLSEKTLTDMRDYVDLLFAPQINEALVHSVNPLTELIVANRHLAVQFSRVQEGAAVRHLLVTVTDISARLELVAALHAERQQAQKEFTTLLKAIDADPALLRQFVGRAEASLLAINDILGNLPATQGDAAVARRLDDITRRIQAVRSDASPLGLDTIASQAHLFETELLRVRQASATHADAATSLLATPLPLEALLDKVGALKSLSGLQRPAPDTEAETPEAINDAMSRLATQLAHEAGKQMNVTVRMGSHADLDDMPGALLWEIAVQLVRNAVNHGIEAPAQRMALGKPAEGTIELTLARGESDWTLTVRDDGVGLSSARVRERLLALRWYTPEQLDNFNERQVMSHIFKPGFSMAAGPAGATTRGVGLELVQANVQKLGARMQLSTKPGEFTEFKVKFA